MENGETHVIIHKATLLRGCEARMDFNRIMKVITSISLFQ